MMVANPKLACAATMFVLLLLAPCQAPAQVIHDNFENGVFDLALWAPCPRVENTLEVQKDQASGFAVARLTVRAYPQANLLGLALAKRNCVGETPFDDKNERAEIWESGRVRLNFGSDVWYGFDMYIDDAVSRDEPRLIVGQWKGPHDDSPMLAQRFQQHIFSITIEQPNLAPGHDPNDSQCQIIIAHDANLASEQSGDLAHSLRLLEAVGHVNGAELLVGSVGHDPADIIHDPRPCRTNVDVKPTNLLPDAFGHWVRMIYHIKVVGDGNGLIEVWANNVPIVTVHGQIGFPGSVSETQYFKFGPYRDQHNLPPIYAMLAHYVRGSSKQEVQ